MNVDEFLIQNGIIDAELSHSAKGSTWKNHKYLKKVNGRYYYSQDELKTVSDGDSEASEEELIADIKAGKYGSIEDLKKRFGNDYLRLMVKSLSKKTNPRDLAKQSNAKGGKGGSGSSGKKSGGGGSKKEKAAKESKEKKEKEEKEPTFQKYQSTSSGVQKALKTYADLSKGDSISTTKNEDGNWVSTVTYEDGSTQTFVMNKSYRILSKGEKEMKHSDEVDDYLALICMDTLVSSIE